MFAIIVIPEKDRRPDERTGETKEKWRKEEGHFSLNMRPYHESGKVATLRRMFLSLSIMDLKGTE